MKTHAHKHTYRCMNERIKDCMFIIFKDWTKSTLFKLLNAKIYDPNITISFSKKTLKL